MKPLKETRIGQFLTDKNLGHLLDELGDLVPGVRVLGKIKDLVLGDSSLLDEESRKQFIELYRLDLEALDAEIADRNSARVREKEFATATGHIDWFMTVFGLIILLCFVYTVVISAWGNIPEEMREIFIESRAAVRDIVLAIAAYYWGSSAGSRVKDMKRNLK